MWYMVKAADVTHQKGRRDMPEMPERITEAQKITTMPKKQPTILAEKNGQFYIKLAASGIHQLAVFADAMPITFFGKEEIPYLKIEEAIDWHQKEIVKTHGRHPGKDLDALIELHRRIKENDRIIVE